MARQNYLSRIVRSNLLLKKSVLILNRGFRFFEHILQLKVL